MGSEAYLWVKHKRWGNWNKYRYLFQGAFCVCEGDLINGPVAGRKYGIKERCFFSIDGRHTWYFPFSFPSPLNLSHHQVLFILCNKLVKSIHFSPLPPLYPNYYYPPHSHYSTGYNWPLPLLLPSFNLFSTLQLDIFQMQI